ncbi:nucleoside phosphorylase [Mucilaginibacter sp.]|jgi:uridine phosphorylase|uniref:nucleoside phosphorylase n=1 Tax=Mucilaginibacter sp. TaxID=1882438 RepID=UPI00356180E1
MKISDSKYYHEDSVFKPENLLREVRRQKSLPDGSIPSICLLDPDGDILDYLLRTGQARINTSWACYHTKLYEFRLEEYELGIIACAVGASFAVLLAEQLFVSGCQTLISITSSGLIGEIPADINYILIEDAIRDEGTSYHYLPPEKVSGISSDLLARLKNTLPNQLPYVGTGRSWTTDAPYRETAHAIEDMRAANVQVVEMEAAALYAFAEAKNKDVICFAHITNSMAQNGTDFEKGLEQGSISSLALVLCTLKGLATDQVWIK